MNRKDLIGKKGSMKKRFMGIFVCTLLIATSVTLITERSAADWQEGDDYKMHFPQLPDSNGWDVNATWPWNVLADDWNCTESGPVTDIHFWGSWRYDMVGIINGFYISIWSNNPGDPQQGIPSHPETLLWSEYITDFKIVGPEFGAEGWYEPGFNMWYQGDHESYYQYNIVNITDPFWQENGTIYWLSISANVTGGYWGWKTSIYTNVYDDAFWGYYSDGIYYWDHELYIDPPSVSMDLAFVITGTPCCNKDWNYWTNWPNIWLIPGGNVGIGTTNPQAKLDVRGSATFNDDGGDYDFRIESENMDSIFKIDASKDQIQLGVPHAGKSAGVIFTIANNGNMPLEMISCSNTSFYRGIMNFYRARGTVDSPFAVINNDRLGDLQMKGYDGTTYRDAARVSAYVDGTPQSGYVPGKLVFQTAYSGSPQTRMTIRANGNVGINTTNPQYELDVQGAIQADEYHTGDIYFQKDGKPLWRMFEDGNGLYVENLNTGKIYPLLSTERGESTTGLTSALLLIIIGGMGTALALLWRKKSDF